MIPGPNKMQGQTVIFLHVPKAGGTTLHKIIQKQYNRDLTYSIDGSRVQESIRKFKELDEPSRARIALLKGHMPFGLHEFLPQPSTYVTILREPVDRVISHYYFVLRKTNHYAHRRVVEEKMGLKEYVDSGIVWETDNGQTRQLAGVSGTVDFGQCTSAILETAKENLRRFFSVVGLVEHYDETLILLRRTFGWRMPFYVRRNVTRNRPLQENPPENTFKLIQQRNKLDIELYEYAQTIMKEQIARQTDLFEQDLKVFRILNRLYRPYGRLRALAYAGYSEIKRK